MKPKVSKPVYVVGPCGSGKTTIGKIFHCDDVDELAAINNPGLFARKPWRYWIKPDESLKADAEQWNLLQEQILYEVAEPGNLVIAHPASLLQAARKGLAPRGIVVILQPHRDATKRQRAKCSQDALDILDVNWRDWDARGQGRDLMDELGTYGFECLLTNESLDLKHLVGLVKELLTYEFALDYIIAQAAKTNPEILSFSKKNKFV